MFSVHSTPEKCESTAITDDLGLMFKANREGKSHDYLDVIVVENLHYQKCFRPHYAGEM